MRILKHGNNTGSSIQYRDNYKLLIISDSYTMGIGQSNASLTKYIDIPSGYEVASIFIETISSDNVGRIDEYDIYGSDGSTYYTIFELFRCRNINLDISIDVQYIISVLCKSVE